MSPNLLTEPIPTPEEWPSDPRLAATPGNHGERMERQLPVSPALSGEDSDRGRREVRQRHRHERHQGDKIY